MEALETLNAHQDKLFWGLFVVIGVLLIVGILANIPFLEIPTGLMLIILGLNQLLEEVDKRKKSRSQEYINANIHNIRHLAHTTHTAVKNIKTRHERRFHNINQRRALTDKKVDQNYRELVRKILEIENDMSDIKRMLKASK